MIYSIAFTGKGGFDIDFIFNKFIIQNKKFLPMKRFLFIIFIIILGNQSAIQAQSLQVKEQHTGQPLEGAKVVFYSTEQPVVAYTNKQGKVSIPATWDSVKISIVGYQTVISKPSEIDEMQNTVLLSVGFTQLEDVLIAAHRWEIPSQETPQKVELITSRQLAWWNQQTSADVLQSSGNIFLQKSQQGGGSPVIRGFEANRVLIVVDGIRMNNAIYRAGHLQNVITLDNQAMDKIEVLYGPSSVFYGSDALGGVMHFYTKNPILSDTSNIITRTNAFVRYATANQEKTGHVDFAIGGMKWGSITSATFSKFEDLRTGNIRNPLYGDWGKRLWFAEHLPDDTLNIDTIKINPDPNLQIGSSYYQYDLLQKFLFQPNNKQKHLLNLQFSNSGDVPRYDRLTLLSGGNPRFAEWYYGPQKRLLAAYHSEWNISTPIFNQFKTAIYYQDIEESRHTRRFKSKSLNSQIDKVKVLGLNVDCFNKWNKDELSYGIEAWHNIVNSTGTSTNIFTNEEKPWDTRYPDGGSTMQSFAFFIANQFYLSPKWTFSQGLRWNYIALNANFKDTTFFPFPFSNTQQRNQAITGNLGFTFKPTPTWRISALLSSGFKAPNVDDLAKVFESVPGKLIVPNPDLKPEYTYNAEFNLSKTFNNQTQISAGAFYTLYRNAFTALPFQWQGQDSIFYDGQVSQIIALQNKQKAFLYGGFASIFSQLTPNFSIYSTLHYNFGRIETDTVPYPLDHIPPIFGRTSFNYQKKKFRGEFWLLYNGPKMPKNYNLYGEDNASFSADPLNGFMPAWCTFNLRAGYQILPSLQIFLALENLFDHHYRTFASNISAPGRNFIITIRANL